MERNKEKQEVSRYPFRMPTELYEVLKEVADCTETTIKEVFFKCVEISLITVIEESKVSAIKEKLNPRLKSRLIKIAREALKNSKSYFQP